MLTSFAHSNTTTNTSIYVDVPPYFQILHNAIWGSDTSDNSIGKVSACAYQFTNKKPINYVVLCELKSEFDFMLICCQTHSKKMKERASGCGARLIFTGIPNHGSPSPKFYRWQHFGGRFISIVLLSWGGAVQHRSLTGAQVQVCIAFCWRGFSSLYYVGTSNIRAGDTAWVTMCCSCSWNSHSYFSWLLGSWLNLCLVCPNESLLVISAGNGWELLCTKTCDIKFVSWRPSFFCWFNIFLLGSASRWIGKKA